ncbi:DUF4012 domain-containing protein [Microbacterium sp. BH-3-3-3]|uniref:DUF4012 domain-containing protein n=1 Tax=Microbacterium sp. BH-3-3-3 TaxID=1906742 RepID=UPI0021B35494|nr:DUF4012 domain-containing protein [Microbacterium sp. BH-3-3-3]
MGSLFAGAVMTVLILGLVATAWIGVRAATAYGHLQAAESTVATAASALDDPSTAVSALASVSADTSEARSLTSDPVWELAETLPWVGPQLAAVSTTTAAVDAAVSQALAPLSAASAGLSVDALRPVDGVIDVTRIAAIAPAADSAHVGLAQAAGEVAAIDRSPLIGRVADAVSRSAEVLKRAADAADALSRATRLVPAMLGAERPRSTLVLFENNAEWRSLGGVVGAVAQLDTRDGRMTLTAQASTADFAAMGDAPVVDLPADVIDVYDTRPARFIQNTTQVPDFSVGAPVAREMWRRLTGNTVDSVVALDPVTLSYLLRATGPVTLPSGDELTADNAVPLLLSDVYRRFPDPRTQDAFFQSASASVFQALAGGRFDPAAVIDAVSRAGAERRLLVWNADAVEQATLDGTTLQGALPVSDTARSTFGVYLNDGTGSKMDYYLHPEVETAWCDGDRASLHVSLRNDAPDAESLPRYVTGGGDYGVPVGDALTGVYVYLPLGAEPMDRQTTTTGAIAPGFADGVHEGRYVVKWSPQLGPGQSADLDLEVKMPRTAVLDAISTPTRDGAEVPRAGACRFPG